MSLAAAGPTPWLSVSTSFCAAAGAPLRTGGMERAKPFTRSCSREGTCTAALATTEASSWRKMGWCPKSRVRSSMDGSALDSATKPSSPSSVPERTSTLTLWLSRSSFSTIASISWLEKTRWLRSSVSFWNSRGSTAAAMREVTPKGTTSRFWRSLQLMQMEWKPIRKKVSGLSTPRITDTAPSASEPLICCCVVSSRQLGICARKARTSRLVHMARSSAGMRNSRKPS
mmetsp:Transcript_2298/g.6705  ORF Transcript_2298/g.6705 Transcript_2298/m.6705 type:complete len:229 (-) Transcript_2298:589-1275(-)